MVQPPISQTLNGSLASCGNGKGPQGKTEQRAVTGVFGSGGVCWVCRDSCLGAVIMKFDMALQGNLTPER